MSDLNKEVIALIKEMRLAIKIDQEWKASAQYALLSIAADPTIDRIKLLERYDELLAGHESQLPDLLIAFRR